MPLPRRRRGDGGKRTCGRTLGSKEHFYIRVFEWLDIKINHSNFKIGRQEVSSCQMSASKYPKTNHTRQNIVQVEYSTLIKVITTVTGIFTFIIDCFSATGLRTLRKYVSQETSKHVLVLQSEIITCYKEQQSMTCLTDLIVTPQCLGCFF